VEEVTADGVPEISPSEVSNVRPAGSVGVIDQVTTAPPPVVGAIAVIETPLVKVIELVLYDTVGAASLTRIVTVVVALPPLLEAVTVYVVAEETADGVPEISPLEVSRDRPAGSVGEIDHEVTVPPLELGEAAVIAEPFVNVRKLGL
jgi:hypothetical protein